MLKLCTGHRTDDSTLLLREHDHIQRRGALCLAKAPPGGKCTISLVALCIQVGRAAIISLISDWFLQVFTALRIFALYGMRKSSFAAALLILLLCRTTRAPLKCMNRHAKL